MLGRSGGGNQFVGVSGFLRLSICLFAFIFGLLRFANFEEASAQEAKSSNEIAPSDSPQELSDWSEFLRDPHLRTSDQRLRLEATEEQVLRALNRFISYSNRLFEDIVRHSPPRFEAWASEKGLSADQETDEARSQYESFLQDRFEAWPKFVSLKVEYQEAITRLLSQRFETLQTITQNLADGGSPPEKIYAEAMKQLDQFLLKERGRIERHFASEKQELFDEFRLKPRKQFELAVKRRQIRMFADHDEESNTTPNASELNLKTPASSSRARLELMRGDDGHIIAKYVPIEDFKTRRALKHRFRIFFTHLALTVNQGREFRHGRLFDRRISRTLFDSDREALVLQTENGRIVDGKYYRKPKFLNGLVPNWDYLRRYTTATYEAPKWTSSIIFGFLSAIVQGGITWIVFETIDPQHNHIAGAAATFAYCMTLTTFARTYDRWVRRGHSLIRSVSKRVILSLPLLEFIQLVKYGPETLFKLGAQATTLIIATGDKFASEIWSFIPRVRERHRLSTEGSYFGFEKPMVERDMTAWARMAIQMIALAVANGDVSTGKTLAQGLVWGSAVPMYLYDKSWGASMAQKIPDIEIDTKRLVSHVAPRSILAHAREATKELWKTLTSPRRCAYALKSLFGRI